MKNRQRHTLQAGRAEVEAFLSDLGTRGRVNASTQNQALGALLLLCCKVLVQRLPGLDDVVRTKRSARLPTLLSMSELRAPLGHREGQPQLVATPFYGTGLSLLEALQLRVRDVDLHSRILTIRAGKGDRDRRAILPESCRALVSTAIELSLAQHPADLERGAGWVELPHALDRKHSGAGRTIPLQWVFPTTRIHRRR